ncbi:Imm27 family immunity protein [Marinifilum sp. RC60d5]|uniref:Imm27 family immunity protein n=1 Tax=Marinifilum sp. RC60d5 TaxID=3458414 RepID=UPI0040368EE9
MKINKEENILQGKWVLDGHSLKKDEVCQRIDWLVSNFLIKINTDITGWNTLYQDPNDYRYWELTYPKSEQYGGGAPKLENITNDMAIVKYGIDNR